MSAPSVLGLVKRCILPLICAALAVIAAVWGELILVEYAGQPTVGPLIAAQVAVIAAIAFSVLCLITLVLAIFPGRDTSGDEDLYLDLPLDDPDQDLPEPAATTEVADPPSQTPQPLAASVEADQEQTRTAEEIIAALKRSAHRQAQARHVAEQRAEAAEARIDELHALLDTFRDGTAPEMEALTARFREEASRAAMTKVHELGEAADRLQQALRDAHARTQADLAAKDEAMAAQHAEMSETLAAQQAAMAALEARIEDIRRGAAIDEYQRIRIALAAINDTHLDVLDHLQRDAVQRHADRITAALDRLNPAQQSLFGPDMAMPPMEPGAANGPAETGPQDEHSPARRGLRRKKGKRSR